MAEVEEIDRLDPSAPLALALDRSRDRFNAQVAMAVRMGSRMDPVFFSQVLVDAVAPAVASVQDSFPSHVDEVTRQFFTLTLDLLARDTSGSQAGFRAWKEILPQCPHLFIQDPYRLAASLFNACHNLNQVPGNRLAPWILEISKLATTCTSAKDLWGCGGVLAWRFGLAHLRASALVAWDRLPEPLARATLGLDSALSLDEVRARLADPWWIPGAPAEEKALKVVGWTAGFRGFGREFLVPPAVAAEGDQIFVSDGNGTFTIHADCFGVTLQPVAKMPESKGINAQVSPTGQIVFSGLKAYIPQATQVLHVAATSHLVAMSFPYSHRVLLVACTQGLP